MSSIKDLEKAVENLPPDDLARFRAWFDNFDAGRFDEKIEHSVRSGALDKLADEAMAAHHAGHSRKL